MAAMGVVPALDGFEAGHARFYLGFEAVAVAQFAFERGEEACAHRVIKPIADRAHRGPHAGLAAAPAEGERSVLATPGGMMNHGGRPPLPQRQLERLQHQFGAQRGFHRAADASAAESVENHRQVKKPGPGREVSFESIPRSSRSTRCSRRSRLSSSRSAVVSPSRRRASSSPAGLTHLRIALAEASTAPANGASGRPVRASSMMRRRYSGAYAGWVRGIGRLLLPFSPTPSTKAGQLQISFLALSPPVKKAARGTGILRLD